MVENKTFTHSTNNTLLNPPVDITIYHKDIHFKDGYGVATFKRNYRSIDTSSKDEINYLENELTYMGIVDENLEEILPFKGIYEHIENYGEGHFLVTVRFEGINTLGPYHRHEHYHMYANGKKIDLIDKFLEYSYERIDDETIFVDGVFYNIKKCKVVDGIPKQKLKHK